MLIIIKIIKLIIRIILNYFKLLIIIFGKTIITIVVNLWNLSIIRNTNCIKNIDFSEITYNKTINTTD